MRAYEKALMEADEAISLNPQLPGPHLVRSQALVSIYGKKVMESRRNVPRSTSELTAEERAERRKKRTQAALPLVESAKSLEIYLALNPLDSSVEVWREQRATLKVFASYGEEESDAKEVVFSNDDLTTKPRVLAKPEPPYTEAARQAGVTGVVVLRAVFATDGTIRHILVVNGLPYGLTEQAFRAARQIRFVPGTIAGRPVSTFDSARIQFQSLLNASILCSYFGVDSNRFDLAHILPENEHNHLN